MGLVVGDTVLILRARAQVIYNVWRRGVEAQNWKDNHIGNGQLRQVDLVAPDILVFSLAVCLLTS